MGAITHSISPVGSRFIAHEPLPGIAEVDFLDAAGVLWTVSDKTAVFSSSTWNRDSGPPDDVGVECFIIRELGVEQVEVELAWGCESTTGHKTFTINRALLQTR